MMCELEERGVRILMMAMLLVGSFTDEFCVQKILLEHEMTICVYTLNFSRK